MGNPSLDPAANIFGSVGSPSNMFTNQSSPDSVGDVNYGNMNNFYGQNIGQMMGMGGPMSFDMGLGKGDGPMLSASTSMDSAGDGGQGAGEVFMGVQSPQPGGIPSWKWTMGSDGQGGPGGGQGQDQSGRQSARGS